MCVREGKLELRLAILIQYHRETNVKTLMDYCVLKE